MCRSTRASTSARVTRCCRRHRCGSLRPDHAAHADRARRPTGDASDRDDAAPARRLRLAGGKQAPLTLIEMRIECVETRLQRLFINHEQAYDGDTTMGIPAPGPIVKLDSLNAEWALSPAMFEDQHARLTVKSAA